MAGKRRGGEGKRERNGKGEEEQEGGKSRGDESWNRAADWLRPAL